MKILVTGGAGFIGSHTSDRLLALGHEVVVLDALTEPVHRAGVPMYLSPGVEFYQGDVRNRELMTNLLRRVDAVYHFAAAHYPTQQLVLWGESLGSAVAIAVAAEQPVGRVILEAPFTSAVALGAQHYWYLPVRLLMKDQFHSDTRIGKVSAPLLIMHGLHDRTVPYAMGERLFDLANKPKHLARFLDGGHEDLDENGALDAVARFLAGDLD